MVQNNPVFVGSNSGLKNNLSGWTANVPPSFEHLARIVLPDFWRVVKLFLRKILGRAFVCYSDFHFCSWKRNIKKAIINITSKLTRQPFPV